MTLATGPCGRLGLPASGYLHGTYENPTNAGDGYAMAYHAGAELSGNECFQINPLIKDYNGPACAYVAPSAIWPAPTPRACPRRRRWRCRRTGSPSPTT